MQVYEENNFLIQLLVLRTFYIAESFILDITAVFSFYYMPDVAKIHVCVKFYYESPVVQWTLKGNIDQMYAFLTLTDSSEGE